MQAAERPESTDGHRNGTWHARHDPTIQEEQSIGNLADADELSQALIVVAAPTEPTIHARRVSVIGEFPFLSFNIRQTKAWPALH